MQSTRDKLIAVAVVAGVLAAAVGGYCLLKGSGLGEPPKLGPGFEYDLTRFVKARSVGTYVRVSQTQPAPRGHSIALAPAGGVYIGGDGTVTVCDADGKGLRTERMGTFFGEQKTDPKVHSLAVAADGTVYAGLAGGIAIREGGKWRSWLTRPGGVIVSIALDGGAVYATDYSTASLLCLTREGKLLREIDGRTDQANATMGTSATVANAAAVPPRGAPRGSGFVLPSPYFDVAVAPDGLLRVANTGLRRVEAWTPAGSREFAWGKAGPGLGQFSGCCNPAALAVLADGRIVTAEKGSLLTVTIYKPDGPQAGAEAGDRRLEAGGAAGASDPAPGISAVVAGPDQFLANEEGGVDVAVAPTGRVYVLQTPAGVLSIFDPPKEGRP